MNIAELFIRRPVMTTLVMIGILLLYDPNLTAPWVVEGKRSDVAGLMAAGLRMLERTGKAPDALLRLGQSLVWRRPPWEEPAVPLAFAVLYRFGPSREEARWRWVRWGAAFAAATGADAGHRGDRGRQGSRRHGVLRSFSRLRLTRPSVRQRW